MCTCDYNVIKFKKIRNVKSPSRGTSKSAGIDFYVPNDFPPVTLYTNEAVNVPSGIEVQLPKNTCLVAFNKSGMAINGLQVGAQVVDEDYTSEIHLHVRNVSRRPVQIIPGKKLVQFLLLPAFYAALEQAYELNHDGSERQGGGFGSTGLD